MSAFGEENDRARHQLAALVERLTDEDLIRPLEAGWTVAAVLAHLAFWDCRALLLIRKWRQEGIGPSPIDVDVVNEATRSLCLGIPPRRAAGLALEYAGQIDAEIEHLDAELLAGIESRGQTVRLDRAAHRRGHLGQIEQALGSP